MYLFYVRHGQPDYENDSITDYGKSEAKALAERFALLGLDKIYSSTMGRALQTAAYTAEKIGIGINGVDFAREDLAVTDFAVKTDDGKKRWCFVVDKIIKQFRSKEVKNLGENWYDSPLYVGTNFKQGIIRIKKAVTDFMVELGYEYNAENGTYRAKKHKYNRVALFAHEGFFMPFGSCLMNIPYPLFSTMFQRMSTSTVTVFKLDDEGDNLSPQICQYSNDSHIYAENLLDGFDRRSF